MGRKNRKGRSGGQHPRRFYRPKGEHPGSRRGAAAAAGEDAIAAWPEPSVAPVSEAPAAAPTCGRCAEWTPRAGLLDGPSGGTCLHPGSGISYPPAEMQACAFFH